MHTLTETLGAEPRRGDARGPLAGRTTLVVGASRGVGRGIAAALAEAGADVVAVSRAAAAFPEPAGGGSLRQEVADAADPTAAASLIDRHDPSLVVLVAGATPHMRPLQEHTWDTFSVHWQTDVRIAFHWLREALLRPLKPGGRVVVISSGAAVGGSSLSGGYAGSKATQRFITAYAQDEANRAGLGLTFTAVLPRFSPETGVGQAAVRAYAARAGKSIEAYLQSMGPLVSPQIAGAAVVELATADPTTLDPAYLLNGAGLQKLP